MKGKAAGGFLVGQARRGFDADGRQDIVRRHRIGLFGKPISSAAGAMSETISESWLPRLSRLQSCLAPRRVSGKRPEARTGATVQVGRRSMRHQNRKASLARRSRCRAADKNSRRREWP